MGCPLRCCSDLLISFGKALAEAALGSLYRSRTGCPLLRCSDLLISLGKGLAKAAQDCVVFLHKEQGLLVELVRLFTLLQLQPAHAILTSECSYHRYQTCHINFYFPFLFLSFGLFSVRYLYIYGISLSIYRYLSLNLACTVPVSNLSGPSTGIRHLSLTFFC